MSWTFFVQSSTTYMKRATRLSRKQKTNKGLGAIYYECAACHSAVSASYLAIRGRCAVCGGNAFQSLSRNACRVRYTVGEVTGEVCVDDLSEYSVLRAIFNDLPVASYNIITDQGGVEMTLDASKLLKAFEEVEKAKKDGTCTIKCPACGSIMNVHPIADCFAVCTNPECGMSLRA